jgi:hypothetical protein
MALRERRRFVTLVLAANNVVVLTSFHSYYVVKWMAVCSRYVYLSTTRYMWVNGDVCNKWLFFFTWWRAPQQTLRTHHNFKAFCATLWWRWAVFFYQVLQAMEHQWNEIDRGKLTTRRKTCPSATLSTTNPTWTDPESNPGLRNGGRRLTAWAMARPNKWL